MVSGNMPAFSAYMSAGTAVPDATYTKLLFASEDFDTNNNFASSRFTPTIAGYYQINSALQLAGSVSASVLVVPSVFKNGSSFKRSVLTASSTYGATVSAILYLNGSTDYVEIYLYQGSGAAIDTNPVQDTTWVNGALVRAA
jgi:hypothetical protein